MVEWIGFLISIGALAFLFLKRAQEVRHESQHPHEEEGAEEDVRTFLRRLNIPVEDVLPPPKKAAKNKSRPVKLPPKPNKVQIPVKAAEIHHPTPEHYQVKSRSSVSRAKRLLNRLPSNKEMVILREILGPPKGLS